MQQSHPLWEEASEMSLTDELLVIKKSLEASTQNLLARFEVHGDDGICISDIEDAIMDVKADLYELENLIGGKDKE
jgi:hypothetical protein